MKDYRVFYSYRGFSETIRISAVSGSAAVEYVAKYGVGYAMHSNAMPDRIEGVEEI